MSKQKVKVTQWSTLRDEPEKKAAAYFNDQLIALLNCHDAWTGQFYCITPVQSYEAIECADYEFEPNDKNSKARARRAVAKYARSIPALMAAKIESDFNVRVLSDAYSVGEWWATSPDGQSSLVLTYEGQHCDVGDVFKGCAEATDQGVDLDGWTIEVVEVSE